MTFLSQEANPTPHSKKPEQELKAARLHPLDKGGQGIHIRGLGTKVVPELVFNAWAGMCHCGSLILDLDSLKW